MLMLALSCHSPFASLSCYRSCVCYGSGLCACVCLWARGLPDVARISLFNVCLLQHRSGEWVVTRHATLHAPSVSLCALTEQWNVSPPWQPLVTRCSSQSQDPGKRAAVTAGSYVLSAECDESHKLSLFTYRLLHRSPVSGSRDKLEVNTQLLWFPPMTHDEKLAADWAALSSLCLPWLRF